MAARSLGTLLALLLVASSASAFKEHEFKKCATSGFCRRHRGKAGPVFAIDPKSIKVDGSEFSAILSSTPGKDLLLELRAYADGFVRLTIDEAGESKRYRITDPAVVQLDGQPQVAWKVAQQNAAAVSLSASSKQGASVTLSLKPFKLEISSSGQPAVSLNSRGLFDFEHRRTKEEAADQGDCDGCWEESFLTFRDSKPHGPEAISLDIGFPGSKHVYGIPERATSFALKPTPMTSEPYRLYNLDVFEYLDESPFGLYGAIPFMVAHKVGLTTGVLMLNAAEMYVDVAAGRDGSMQTQWIAESGIVDLFVFLGPKPADVQRQYADLTGTTALPQMFSIGYHQCRWNYRDEADTREVNANFDHHEIPYDVIWLDIEHTNGKRYLTWDSQKFPQPAQLQEDIAATGRKTVTIVDPHVKRDGSYYIYEQAQQAKYFVQTTFNTDFDGWCWPGSSSYLDVTNADVRAWWAEQFTTDKYVGSTKHLYIWNDMNEPSVFNGPEITMQKDLIHSGSVEHRNVHNLYGLYYHLSTAEGLKLRGEREHGEDGDRPFVLSRAFYSGTQRVGPIWTGDNMANWQHLQVSIPMLLTLGVTGLPFSGADVGGFFGNPDAELLTRWYQVGIYYPFFRGHAHLETNRREPWLFGDETTARIRAAIRERYALLPYLYTLFRHANTTGQPVLRPLWFEFPEDTSTFATEQEFMLGPHILVRPVLQQGATSVTTQLPLGNRWYSTRTGAEERRIMPTTEEKVTLDAIPVFYRGGAIVPRRERPRRSTQTQARDPFTLVVACDPMFKAEGDLYLDDGHSFAFKRGQYVHRSFSFASMVLENRRRADEPGVPAGAWDGAKRLVVERVVFLGLPKSVGSFTAVLPGGKEVLMEKGPVSAQGAQEAPEGGWILRRPNLPVDEDWSVRILALNY